MLVSLAAIAALVVLIVVLARVLAQRPPGGGSRTAPGGASCPLCGDALPPPGQRLRHWETHAFRVGVGPDRGRFTWECDRCGPSEAGWPDRMGAGAGLAHHMRQKHSITL